MEPIEGRPLAEFLSDARAHSARAHLDVEAGKLPVERAVRWAALLAYAIADGHRAGVVHGHVNPDTVIVEADDTITLRNVDVSPASAPPATGLRAWINYLAPEQLRGEPAGQAADVFSFGAIVYVMFIGRDAFPENIGAAALLELATPRASDAQPGLDADVSALVDDCLQKDPSLRPTMEAVVWRFAQRPLVKDEPTTAMPPFAYVPLPPPFLNPPAPPPPLADPATQLPPAEPAPRPPVAASPAPRPPVAAPTPQPPVPAPPQASEPAPVEMPSPFETVAPVSTAKRVDENVQFTLYRPDVIGPDKWYDLVVFAHLASRRPDAPDDEPDPLREVERRAQQIFGPSATPSGRADSAAAIPEEGQLRIVPTVPGIEFNPPEHRFVWLETVHQADFRIHARGAAAGTVARGRITVYLDVLAIAEITVAIRVESGASARQPNQRDVFNPYRRIFASYSHKDEEVVRQFEKYAAGMGDRYMRDVVELRAGEQWQPRLCEMIESADVFQLFWSTNSIASEFVRQEWEHALTVNKRNFIRPIYWELPFPKREGLPPPSLEAIQFAFVGERVPVAAPAPGPSPDSSIDATLERDRQRAAAMEEARQAEMQRAREEEAHRWLEAERAGEARRTTEMERARHEAEARRAAEERARRDAEARQIAAERARLQEEAERLRAQAEARRTEIDRMRREAEAVEARREAEARRAAAERAQLEDAAPQAERARREEPRRDAGYASEIPRSAPRTESAAPARTMSPRLWPIVALAAVAILLVIVALRSC